MTKEANNAVVDGKYPDEWIVTLGKNAEYTLPKVKVSGTFSIYSFDMMGRAEVNKICAASIAERLKEKGIKFDVILTAEAKAIGLAQELSSLYGLPEYVVLRKSVKVYMKNVIEVEIKSITSDFTQHLYLGDERYPLLKNRQVLVLDDVISTGNTLNAFWRFKDQIGFDVSGIATVLTEAEERDNYRGVPLVALDHIPLPTG